MQAVVSANPTLVDLVRSEVAARGPLSARELEDSHDARGRPHWGWNWSAAETVLEWLFSHGEVSSAGGTRSSSGSMTYPSRSPRRDRERLASHRSRLSASLALVDQRYRGLSSEHVAPLLDR